MPEPEAGEVTRLLLAWERGEAAALERLLPIVHGELRRIARRHMRRENPGHTLQTTALVNEAYIRLVEGQQVRWKDRVHFFAVAARLMRRILVDSARSKKYLKRGGGAAKTTLLESQVGAPGQRRDLLALDDALNVLAATDERMSRVVELRVFGGLSVAETAAALKVSPDTVLRDWRLAKKWLRRELGKNGMEPNDA